LLFSATYGTILIKGYFIFLSYPVNPMKQPVLPVIKHKKLITTRLIKTNPSFLITLEHDKKALRAV